MATLKGAVDELVQELAKIRGINMAPQTPLEQITTWPVAMTYASGGELAALRASTEDKSLHDVQIAVVMPFNDMRQCVLTMVPLYERIVDALLTHHNANTSSHYSTWTRLSYTLGRIEWPRKQEMYGYIFEIGGLKIINELSS